MYYLWILRSIPGAGGMMHFLVSSSLEVSMSLSPTLVYAVIGLIAILLLFVLLLLVVVLKRTRGAGGPLTALEQRLAQLDRLGADINELSKTFLIPHARGGFGESLLSALLATWLPKEQYSLQYRFTTGVRVDAVIRLGEKLVPVDAKFPLESVRRAMEDPETPGVVTPEVKKTFIGHVKSIAEKYILPAEGTLQFALLYIPSEKIFYHVFVGEDSGMMEEAVRRGVVPVSPSGLFLYLQTVAYGLKGFALSKNLEKQATGIARVKRDLFALEKVLDTGGNHLKNLQNSFEEIRRRTAALSLGLSALDTLQQEDEQG